MHEKFLHNINKHNLCTKSDVILLGVSGGRDSVCMLHMFRKLNFRIAIAHCNFKLRGNEANQDELFVKDLAQKYNIPIHTIRFDTSDYAQSNGISIQMAARELRYNWFNRLQKEHKYNYTAIAHNKDDVIETFFINLTRGSGIKGFSGIKTKVNNIIRPLLFVSRNEITTFLNENNYNYRDDSSNSSVKYSRNLIRHEVIPLFEKINPGFRNTMLENIERLNQTEQIYNETVQKALGKIKVTKDNRLYINISDLKSLHPIETYMHELLSPFKFSATQINDIVCSLDSTSGKKFLSDTHRLIKDRTELVLEENISLAGLKYNIDFTDKTIETPLRIKTEKFEKTKQFALSTDKNIGLFDFDKLKFPLVLRRWNHGDSFIPLGMSGIKKLSDFFIDQKFSLIKKENIWILESDNKIVWIVGVRIDNRFKITEKTKEIFKLKLL